MSFEIGDIVLAAYDSTELEVLSGPMPAKPSIAASDGRYVACAGMCHRVRRLRDGREGWARPEDLRHLERQWIGNWNSLAEKLGGWKPEGLRA